MTALTKLKMTVDEFLAWAEGQPQRYELVDGELYAMAVERIAHAERKGAAYTTLQRSIRKRGLSCHARDPGRNDCPHRRLDSL